MLLILRKKAPRLSAPHVDGWRWEHLRGLNVPVRRKWIHRYSAGNVPDVAAYFLTSATGWALHKHTRVDRDAIRLRGEAPKVRPLVIGIVMSRFTHCHAIAWIAIVTADHVGHLQRLVFIKVGIERAMHTTRIGLQTIRYCSLLSLDLENAFNTISRRSFVAELRKNELRPIIPLVEMIYSRDSIVYYFDPNDASLLYGLVSYGCPTKLSSRPAFVLLGNEHPPSGILGNGVRILRRSQPSMTMESIGLKRRSTRL
jgi:hypothetical protein